MYRYYLNNNDETKEKKEKAIKNKFKEKPKVLNVFTIQGFCNNSNSFGQNIRFGVPNGVGQLGL